MSENSQVKFTHSKYQWLDTVETVSVAGSVFGAVVSVIVNQAAIAAIPLSVTMALNLMNRRLLLDTLKQNNLAAITQVLQEQVKTQSEVEILNEQLGNLEQVSQKNRDEAKAGLILLDDQLQHFNTNSAQNQDTNNQAIAQLKQQDSEAQTKLEGLHEKLEQLQQMTDKLVQEQNNRLMNEQAKIAKTVDALRDIETCTQSIRINPVSANAFFNRGLSYQRLGDRQVAIEDFTEAIKLNSSYAEAYQNRGLAYADLGDKKAAVKDLREAARLFFDSGEIEKYQIARDLSKKFYELDSPAETEVNKEEVLAVEYSEDISIDSLFSF